MEEHTTEALNDVREDDDDYYFIPTVVTIQRVKSKAENKRNAGTAKVVLTGCVGESAMNGNCVIIIILLIQFTTSS